MGFVIVISIIVTYLIGQRYASPDMVIASVTALTVVLMIIMHVIVQAFEQVVVARHNEGARAKEALLLRDQFVYVAIHHLRSGGTAIKWGLKLLEGSAKTPETTEVVQQMRRKNDDLLKLSNNILLATRIDSGALTPVREAISVPDIIRGALDDEKDLIAERRVRVLTEIPDNLPTIAADPNYTREMLGLLVDNAVEHCDYTSPLLRIAAEQKGAEVLISVQNNGPAIPAGEAEHVFEQYWRSSGPGGGEGTGFPLYNAHALAKIMGGRIWFTSVPDATNFTVALPIQ